MHIKPTLRLLLAVILLLAGIGIGGAMAEDALFEAEMELFSAGDLPQLPFVRTYALNDLDSYIYEQLKAGSNKIVLTEYQITPEDLPLTLTMIVNDHPDLFHVGSKILYYNSGDYVGGYIPQYLFTGDDLAARQEAFNASVSRIAADARQASTTIGRLMRVNDYFCTHFSFETGDPIYRPDQLFSGGTGVCQAYMLGYAAVLDALGIENTHATSPAMVHTWNMVEVDGSWYHIDVTWNDPVPDVPLYAEHSYFLLSDSAMLTAEHYGWESSALALNTQYDSCFWRSIVSPLAVTGDHIYYLSDTAPEGLRAVMDWSSATNTASEVFRFRVPYCSGAYGPIAADAESIYYASGETLWAADHLGEDPRPVFSTGESGRYIWSCILGNGRITMRTGSNSFAANTTDCPAAQRLDDLFDFKLLEMLPGETVQIEYKPDLVLPGFILSSSNESFFSIDADGLLTAAAPGAAHITCSNDAYPPLSYPVIVYAEEKFILPSGIITLEDESFSGIAAAEILLPEGLKSIGAGVFADCQDLTLLHLPDEIESIDPTALPVSSDFTVLCRENTAASALAESMGLACVQLPEA